MVTDPSANAEVQSAFFCSEGAVHDWTYLRDINKTYRCKLCVATIRKPQLKELTDDA